MFLGAHVDEVDHDDATQVAQAQLARYRVRRFQVCFKHRFFKIAGTNKTARVHIDGGERFSLVNDYITARFQFNPTAQRLLQFIFNVVQLEKRPLSLMQLKAVFGFLCIGFSKGQQVFQGFF